MNWRRRSCSTRTHPSARPPKPISAARQFWPHTPPSRSRALPQSSRCARAGSSRASNNNRPNSRPSGRLPIVHSIHRGPCPNFSTLTLGAHMMQPLSASLQLRTDQLLPPPVAAPSWLHSRCLRPEEVDCSRSNPFRRHLN